ncbi:odorant receptor 46a-like [Colletes gigas]|uniref:odorant receptor 46a-like n=1 Tax=Colletes gigas TaxID=935657 RepID=UPI001C9B069C|nr:odorant receptor 46a-like [Colletes gigas]
MIQENFKVMLSIQLLSSTLVVCFNLYELTNTPLNSPKYLEFVMFMACMMVQSFIYCWYGNELKLKSVELVDAIFHLDWTLLDEGGKKSLLIIMSRAMIPIELTCAYIVKMDVDTFVAILKLSYSTYNLLHSNEVSKMESMPKIERNERSGEMGILQSIFRILVVCGCWQPPSWRSPLKKYLYTVYTVIVLLLLYTVTFSQFMDIVMGVQNQDEFSENFYLLLAMLVACYKIYSILKSRGCIAAMTNILETEPFLPGNAEEIGIRSKFDKKAQSLAKFYAILSESSVIYWSCIAFLRLTHGELPVRVWLPYDYTSTYSLSLTYVQQILAFVAGSLMHVACDSLICGLLIHVYSQFEILECRLKAIKAGENQFARMINAEFRMVILIQFTVSTLVVCFSLYILAKRTSFNSMVLQIIMYISCMLTQIFVYCWFGNEVKLKSLEISNMCFKIDWTLLDNNTRRILLMIMKRASEPIEFTSIYIVTMNLEAFVNILKTSYSAYNMLQRGKG